MKYFIKVLISIGLASLIFSCSSDDSTVQGPNPPEPEESEMTLTLNISNQELMYKDYVELLISNSENKTDLTYTFSFSQANVAEVEIIEGKYYINALELGETTLSVGYQEAKAEAKITVVKRNDAIDFDFISIVDNTHALPYLRLTQDREEQKAAEAYIHKQLVKYNSPYTRSAVVLPEDADYLNYISEQAKKEQVGFIETLYGSAAQGYLVGYETLQDARAFIDQSLLPLGFNPLDKDMYTTSMYAYTYDKGENRIILVIMAYEDANTNQKSLRYLTGALW